MPEKVTISHRGARYEIGIGKRYYAIWAAGAPRDEPVDRWPETPEGWSQAWTRFTVIETPGTIAAVPRTSPFAALRRLGADRARAEMSLENAYRRAAAGRIVGAGFLAIGVALGVGGLFPAYFTGQSLAAASYQLTAHIFYLVAWAAATVLVPLGGTRTRVGALLGSGLSAVTLGLFAADLATGMSGHQGVGAGMIISLFGWLACAIGSVLALRVRPLAARHDAAIADASIPEEPGPEESTPEEPGPGSWAPRAWAPEGASIAPAPHSGLDRPRKADIGTVALLALCAIGAAVTFLPSWDRYTLVQASSSSSQTITAGYAFHNPGTVIAGEMITVLALVTVAVLAALWKPARQGAALLGGAIVAVAAQAVSALIQASGTPAPESFGISSAQARAIGLTISSGVTSIFWVYVVFVIAMAISCAWLLTAPSAAEPSAPVPANPVPGHPGPGYLAGPSSTPGAQADEDSPDDDGAALAEGSLPDPETDGGRASSEDSAPSGDSVPSEEGAPSGHTAPSEDRPPSEDNKSSEVGWL